MAGEFDAVHAAPDLSTTVPALVRRIVRPPKVAIT